MLAKLSFYKSLISSNRKCSTEPYIPKEYLLLPVRERKCTTPGCNLEFRRGEVLKLNEFCGSLWKCKFDYNAVQGSRVLCGLKNHCMVIQADSQRKLRSQVKAQQLNARRLKIVEKRQKQRIKFVEDYFKDSYKYIDLTKVNKKDD
eukprot:GHVL01012077.1.p1 GENE.GHVL01012077.1~~GHVL01012077.1.p1  ORF type:complete len:146 (-),score=11.49 GHVL01012077.1:289-726(-)